jgi:hypothetical protein
MGFVVPGAFGEYRLQRALCRPTAQIDAHANWLKGKNRPEVAI